MLRPIGCCPGTLGSEARWTPRGPPVDPPWTPGPAVHHLTAGILLVGLFGTVLGFREVLDAIATMGAEVPGSASRSAVARGSSIALIPVVWAGLGACVGHGAGALERGRPSRASADRRIGERFRRSRTTAARHRPRLAPSAGGRRASEGRTRCSASVVRRRGARVRASRRSSIVRLASGLADADRDRHATGAGRTR